MLGLWVPKECRHTMLTRSASVRAVVNGQFTWGAKLLWTQVRLPVGGRSTLPGQMSRLPFEPGQLTQDQHVHLRLAQAHLQACAEPLPVLACPPVCQTVTQSHPFSADTRLDSPSFFCFRKQNTHARVQVLVPSIYLALVAAAGCIVSGALMLTTFAADELRDVLADTLQQIGVCISGCGAGGAPG